MIYNVLTEVEVNNTNLVGVEHLWVQYHTEGKVFTKNLVPIPYNQIKGILVPLIFEDKDIDKTIVLTPLTVRGFQNYISKLES